ncbi:MAG TPA: alcohol dehydrogenase catalytic domain-containing protein [Syntrophales bacterium]|mgnify:FL=1|jgi:L-iditol 2-dehydrogenase|nr:alcohol dehydrogenase catalytic domain-containing protein [Syntrophales bacterium]HRT62494.1 alcohol dehydrogenase catalytic domain-containing protein [Syntrophales bacterium]
MRVAMYYHNNDVRLEEMPVPTIGPGELLVKVMASGICGSDVMEWYRIQKAPRVLGHEIAGVVVETGSGVEKYRTGDRVFVSHHIPCNTCRYCLRGYHTACETLHTTNYDPGGFAEYIRVPRLNVDRGVFVLPEAVTFEQGVFVEPLACAVRGQRIARLRPGQSVLILGSGISGLLHLLLARALGAGRIFATDVSDYRLDAARRMGADAAFHASENVPARLRELNGGELAELVIVCTGALPAFRQALRSVDRGGTVLCFATTEPGVDLPVPINEFWRNEIKLMPSYGNSPLDALETIELLREKRVVVEPLVTHRLGLAETGMGFRLVAAAGQSVKVIIEPFR